METLHEILKSFRKSGNLLQNPNISKSHAQFFPLINPSYGIVCRHFAVVGIPDPPKSCMHGYTCMHTYTSDTHLNMFNAKAYVTPLAQILAVGGSASRYDPDLHQVPPKTFL